MAEDKHSKTEKPTAKRRKEAKDEGNIPKTPDLSAWLTVLAFVVLGPYTVDALHASFVQLMSEIPRMATRPDAMQIRPILEAVVVDFFKIVGPMVFATMVLGVLGHVVQGGVHVSSKRFKPKWKKLNPVPGIKNMMGAQAIWTLVKTLIKFVVFGFVAYVVTSGVVNQLTGTGRWSLSAMVSVGANSAMNIMRIVAISGLVIAAADWAMERRRVEKSLRMSKDEIKREAKMQEGDPHLKAAVKSRAREMARSRMMADVAGATVVLANPTHVAVALKYEPGGGAPQVVAKGAGHLAARIREKAEENQVPIVRDPLVTRMLYKMCEVGHYIAPDLYDAIAQVLAFVFYLDQLGKAEGTHESPVVHDTQDIPEEYSDDALGLKAHPGADPDFAGAGAGAVAADAGEDDASYVGAGAAADGPVLTRSERRRQERAAGRRRGA